jgi:hypothetical protein
MWWGDDDDPHTVERFYALRTYLLGTDRLGLGGEGCQRRAAVRRASVASIAFAAFSSERHGRDERCWWPAKSRCPGCTTSTVMPLEIRTTRSMHANLITDSAARHRGGAGWMLLGRVLPVTFTLLPAVDVADGRAVRLVEGEAGTETAYGAPLDAALALQAGGAEWIHLVDLDAALDRGSNAPTCLQP